MEKGKRMPLLQVRATEDILEELEALVPLVQRDPHFRAGTVSKQDVYRLALSRGIEAIKRTAQSAEQDGAAH